jgi:hypothetical protein
MRAGSWLDDSYKGLIESRTCQSKMRAMPNNLQQLECATSSKASFVWIDH